MRRLTLQLFGGLRANREGGADVASAGRKAQALLAYLALHLNQDCTRDRLATLLWSDRGEKQARQSLRQAVHFLHKALDDDGNAILVSDGDRLTLAPEAVAVDVRDFERLSAANTREALEQARALYAGDFLEGIDVRSEGFEEWLAGERARLRDLAANVLQRLAQTYMDSGEWGAALGTTQKLLALDPLREEGHRILMRLYEGAGCRTLALRQYRTCEETLRRALNTAPAPETVRLHSEIRARNREMVGDEGEGKATAGDEPKLKGREPGRPQHADRKLAGNAVGALPETTIAPPVPSSHRPALWMYAAAAVVVIAAIGAGVWSAGLISIPHTTGPSASGPAAPHLSIVVLPFVNLSNDPDQEYFADGITNNLTTDVSYIADSFVIASNTAFTYKGKTVDAKQIGRELGVRYVLEGSVQRSANQIRVNAQLIDAETGSYLWAESFDRERGDLFAIEDKITKRITQTVHLQLLNIEGQRAERRSTSADAMDYIMRAEAVWQRPISKDNYRALAELYERALQLDEHLPRTLTGMADVLSSRVLDGFSDSPEDDLRRADELLSRALAVDPNYYYAHRIKGNILRMRKRYEEAIVEYETDIALNPMEVRGRSHLARVKILIGEPAAAIPLSEQAMRISPRHPFIGVMQYRLGLANLLLGNTDEAIRWYEKALQTDAVFPLGTTSADAYLELAAALGLKGDKTAAQAALAEAVKRQPEYATIANVRGHHFPDQSDRPKFAELRERTLIEGLRKAGMPE